MNPEFTVFGIRGRKPQGWKNDPGPGTKRPVEITKEAAYLGARFNVNARAYGAQIDELGDYELNYEGIIIPGRIAGSPMRLALDLFLCGFQPHLILPWASSRIVTSMLLDLVESAAYARTQTSGHVCLYLHVACGGVSEVSSHPSLSSF